MKLRVSCEFKSSHSSEVTLVWRVWSEVDSNAHESDQRALRGAHLSLIRGIVERC